MRVFIDTHALIWYVDQDHYLSPDRSRCDVESRE